MVFRLDPVTFKFLDTDDRNSADDDKNKIPLIASLDQMLHLNRGSRN